MKVMTASILWRRLDVEGHDACLLEVILDTARKRMAQAGKELHEPPKVDA